MKRILFISLISLLFLNACEKEETAPIVNIASEEKGEIISFSASQEQVFINRKDTFTLISGGIPPYIVENSEVPNAYIVGDTLFFIAEISSTPLVRKITVSDNRGYNTSQFRFIASPEIVRLRLSNGETSIDCKVTDSLGNVSNTSFSNTTITYSVRTKEMTFSGSNGSQLTFQVDLSLGNDPSGIQYTNPNPYFSDYSKAASSSVNVTYGFFNAPQSLGFKLELRAGFSRFIPFRERVTVETIRTYSLEIF